MLKEYSLQRQCCFIEKEHDNQFLFVKNNLLLKYFKIHVVVKASLKGRPILPWTSLIATS